MDAVGISRKKQNQATLVFLIMTPINGLAVAVACDILVAKTTIKILEINIRMHARSKLSCKKSVFVNYHVCFNMACVGM